MGGDPNNWLSGYSLQTVPPPVPVPNVVGLARAAAESTISAASLTVGSVPTAASATVPAGRVISQNPAAGANAAPGSAVSLVVSSGISSVTYPNLIHRWSFGETGGAGTQLTDSIGTAHGAIINQGASNGTVGGGQVTLAGGGKDATDYVEFPSDLLEGLASVSIETWATEHSVQNWSRVFSFGAGNGNTANAFFLGMVPWHRSKHPAPGETRPRPGRFRSGGGIGTGIPHRRRVGCPRRRGWQRSVPDGTGMGNWQHRGTPAASASIR